MSSSDHKVELTEDARNTSSGAPNVRFVLLRRRMSSSSSPPSNHASSSSILSFLRLPSGENCIRPPQPAVPNWVMALASRCQELHTADAAAAACAGPWFLMTKKLTKTDVDGDENRLLIPAGFVKHNIIPLLSDEEKKASSLNDYPKRKRKIEAQSAEEMVQVSTELQLRQPSKRRKTMEKGRAHGGLQVTSWTMSRWWFDDLSLTCWDRSNGTVLKGGHLKYLYDRSFLREGDHVELWGFRDARCQWHLAIHKSTTSSSSQ